MSMTALISAMCFIIAVLMKVEVSSIVKGIETEQKRHLNLFNELLVTFTVIAFYFLVGIWVYYLTLWIL